MTTRYSEGWDDHRLAGAPGSTARCSGSTLAHTKSVHVLLVEHDSSVAEAVVRDFERNAISVKSVHTLAEARICLRQGSCLVDVVILALHLPDGRGESLLPDIEACARQPAVIIASAFLADLQTAALAYRPIAVSKPVSTTALLRMVRTVKGGYARPVIKRFVSVFHLCKRETEALVLAARGLKAKEVAARMHCSEPTVYGHLARVCKKTGCYDYHEVVAKLFTFACQAVGHTPPDYKALVDTDKPFAKRS